MRVWMTQPAIEDMLADLDDQRLIAQRREAKGLLTMCAGFDEQVYRFRNNPLSRKFINNQQHLVQVHFLCGLEMLLRNFHPIAVLNFEELPNYQPGEKYFPTEAEMYYDREDLIDRYEKHYREVMSGVRQGWADYVRWARPRSFPSWLGMDVKHLIQREQEFRTRRIINF